MKALLNSLWGKLAQNEDCTIVSFIDDFYKLQQLVNDNTIEVTSLDFVDKNLAHPTKSDLDEMSQWMIMTHVDHKLFGIQCFISFFVLFDHILRLSLATWNMEYIKFLQKCEYI